MEFFRRAAIQARRLCVFPGAFNPPTVAHLALARAALARVDEVVFVLPRVFPHKEYEGAAFDERVRMLELALEDEPRCSIAATDRGLFIDIARECREHYGRDTELWFLCGADAAERIVNWDYGTPGAIDAQLREYGLLVAPRKSAYEPPPRLSGRVAPVELDTPCGEISASEVRDRIRSGGNWRHLVPERIAPLVARIYG